MTSSTSWPSRLVRSSSSRAAFHLVFEASHERRVLLTIAPHLVRPLAFLFPLYRGGRLPAWKVRAGMWLYDLLSSFRNVRWHRWLRAKQVRRVEPGLRDRGLIGAALYYDAQTDDARLVIATVRSAMRAGALAANYVETTALLKPDGRVRGAVVRDVLTGQTATIRANVVVNATGPWSDQLRRLDDPQAAPILRLTKGAHVTVPRRRLANEYAVTLLSPVDGRVMFVLPWGDLSYIGTTDTDADASPDGLRVSAADVTYLLRSADAARARAASEATARHLVASYGSEAAAVLNLVDRDRRLGDAIIAGRPEIWAEIAYAVDRELAVRVQDVLVRRLHLFYEVPDHAQSVVTKVAARMKQLLGWDDLREAEELRDYFQVVERGRIKA